LFCDRISAVFWANHEKTYEQALKTSASLKNKKTIEEIAKQTKEMKEKHI
jgi:hypothetical protein